MKPIDRQNNVIISEDVIVSIVELALKDIDGAAFINPGIAENITELLSTRVKPSLSEHKCRVLIEGDEVEVNVYLQVTFGLTIQDAALEIQKKIKERIEDITDLNVRTVNIYFEQMHMV